MQIEPAHVATEHLVGYPEQQERGDVHAESDPEQGLQTLVHRIAAEGQTHVCAVE